MDIEGNIDFSVKLLTIIIDCRILHSRVGFESYNMNKLNFKTLKFEKVQTKFQKKSSTLQKFRKYLRQSLYQVCSSIPSFLSLRLLRILGYPNWFLQDELMCTKMCYSSCSSWIYHTLNLFLKKETKNLGITKLERVAE